MNAVRRMLGRVFPKMDVEHPVRKFAVITASGADLRIAAHDTVDVLRQIGDVEVIEIFDLTPEPSQRVIAGAATRRKNRGY